MAPAKLPDLTRTAVVGTTGAGKTVFATALATALQAPLIELDVLHTNADWSLRTDAQFLDQVIAAIDESPWVFDGNHAAVRNHIWRRATTIIYLDYSLPTILWRLSKRTIQRLRLATGHRESIWEFFFSPRSLLWWAIRSHRDRRRRYHRHFGEKNFGDAQVLVFRKTTQAAAFLKAVRRAD